MPRPLKWGILGAYTIILSKDIHNIAGKNLSIDSSVFVNFVLFPVTCKKSETVKFVFYVIALIWLAFRQVKYLKMTVGTSVL